MLSSMSPLEKMQFVFTCYDFDESGELTLDEMTLSLKSTVTGLCKVSGNDIPTLKDFETIASLAFQNAEKDPADPASSISSEEFLSYISTNPTSSSWVSAYDDLEADEATITQIKDLTLTGCILADASGAKNYVAPVPPPKLQSDAPFLATLEKSKPPAPPPPAEGEDPPPPPKPESSAAPNSSINIEWVHGYCGSSRNNLSYTATGSIVYPAATVGVIYSPADEEKERPEPTQTYFHDANTDITSLVTSSDKKVTACGTSSGLIYIFDSDTAALVAVLSDALPSSMSASNLAFSRDGKLLAAVGSDPDNSLVIFDVASTNPVFTAKTGKSPVLGISFSSSNVDTLTIVSAGTNGVKPIVFWVKSQELDSTWIPKKGIFGSTCQPVPLSCVSNM